MSDPTGQAWDPVLAFTRGDPARATMLRRNLRTIEETSADPEVRRLVGEVLDGRRSVRELVREPAIERELARGMEAFADAWHELSPAERTELVRQAQAQEMARRESEGLPPLDEQPAEIGDSPLLRRG